MRHHDLPQTLTRLVDPRALRSYAESLGWDQVEGVNGRIVVYRNPKDYLRQLIIPLDEQFDDYGDRAAEAIQRLAEFENRPPNELLNHLLLPPSDWLRFREVSPSTETGYLPLDHAAVRVDGVRKVLLSVAHSVLLPQPYHPRMSRSEPESLISRCRLGQTERGSFVLTVACPLDFQAGLFEPAEEPFARQVTTSLLVSLQALSQVDENMDMDALLDTEIHPGMSANLCESLLMLRPEGERAYLIVSATQSRAFRSDADRKALCEVRLSQQVFDVAEALAPRLRSVPVPRIDRFFGFVDELRGQPTPQDNRPSGEVRFTLFDQEEEIRARANLTAYEYALAGEAHLSADLICFKGILYRLPRVNRIEHVTDFRRIPLDEEGIPADQLGG